METIDQDRWVLPASDEEEYVFSHNDLSEYNIIVDPDSLSIKAIMDWEYSGFYPELFESPVYTRHGPRAQVTFDENKVSRMIEFLRSRERRKEELAKGLVSEATT